MDVRGYPTGPIDAKGAFTSEIDLLPMIKPGPLNTFAEADRPHLVDQPGMRHKYLPLRHDPATGAISTGGRYLFRRHEDPTKYRDFLEAKVFPSEQTTFCPACRRAATTLRNRGQSAPPRDSFVSLKTVGDAPLGPDALR